MSVGEILLEQGKITADHLQAALSARKGPQDRLDRVLVRMGFVEEREILEIYGEQLSLPVIELSEETVDVEMLRRMPSKLVHKCGLVPIGRDGDTMRVATSDPFDVYAFDELRMLSGVKKVEPVLASESEIQRVIRNYYGVGGQTVSEMVDEDDVELMSDSVDQNGSEIDEAQEATVVKLVNDIVAEAVRDKASDIHIEPLESSLKIRYRIDGVLQNTTLPPQIERFQAAIVSRIKIMSGLNIAEKRLPQDGAFRARIGGREIDFRVSIIPTSWGEGVVMRILDKQTALYKLTELGFSDSISEKFMSVITRPHGIILVTGPTGSGKTTTLYASLNAIVSDKIKILTVEDPVEYQLDGIQQVQIQPRIGLTFASGLRSFLRHDPDVILVGEIRDQETADVAINASLTGHLVFSTLHTNDAVSANTRLLDMGVEPFLISSSVEAILAQRLLRTICKHCKEEYDPDPDTLPNDFGFRPGEKLYRGRGCRECRHSGYSGRVAIYELLIMTEEMRELIVQRASSGRLMELALQQGLRSLREDGWAKVRAGLTTPEEVLRVSTS